MKSYRIIKETYRNGNVQYAIEKKVTWFGHTILDWRPEIAWGEELKLDSYEMALRYVGANHESISPIVSREIVYDTKTN